MLRTILRCSLPAIALFIVIELAMVGAVEFWPDFKGNIGALKFFTQFKVLRGLLGLLKEGELPAYIIFQHFFKGSMFVVTAAVLFAVNSVANEAHRGTLEIWMARPVSRTRLLMERYVVGVLQLLVPFILATWTIPTLLQRWDETLPLEPLMLGSVHLSCMLLAVYSTTFFFSTIGRHPIRIAASMLFFCVLQLALYLTMEATHYSLVRLVDPRLFIDLFSTLELDWEICGGLLGYTALCIGASIFAFRRRLP